MYCHLWDFEAVWGIIIAFQSDQLLIILCSNKKIGVIDQCLGCRRRLFRLAYISWTVLIGEGTPSFSFPLKQRKLVQFFRITTCRVSNWLLWTDPYQERYSARSSILQWPESRDSRTRVRLLHLVELSLRANCTHHFAVWLLSLEQTSVCFALWHSSSLLVPWSWCWSALLKEVHLLPVFAEDVYIHVTIFLAQCGINPYLALKPSDMFDLVSKFGSIYFSLKGEKRHKEFRFVTEESCITPWSLWLHCVCFESTLFGLYWPVILYHHIVITKAFRIRCNIFHVPYKRRKQPWGV